MSSVVRRSPVSPGIVGPRRAVPSSIARPDYVGKPGPARDNGSWVQTPETIERMRAVGRLAARAMGEAGKAVAPGITTDQLDAIVHEYLCDHGAYPSTLGYRGYPKSCCTSLNEVICHGIPDSTVIGDGDIVKIDVTAYLDGVHGDNCATYLAGEVAPDVRLLVERTEQAMNRAIKAVAPGRRLNVVGRVIEAYGKRFGYGVVRDYTGHGIAGSFHSGLVVLHYDDPTVTTVLEPGMTFTIEPMITLGGIDWELWPDDWTVTTKDKSWCAQFEQTMVVTDSGVEVLTVP